MSNHDLLSAKEEPRSRFFYGYTILLVSFLILVVAFGAQFSFGVFLKPVLNEFGWTRAVTSGAFSLNMVLNGVFGILAGRLSDRFGPRLVLTVGGLLIGLGYLLMSQVNAIWQIYLFYGLFVSIGMSGIFVPLLSTAVRWFPRRKGLASGIVASGAGVGTIIMPPLANLLISSFSWRTAYVILGFMAIAFIIILAQFLRRAPNQKISLPDKADVRNAASLNVQVHGLSLREAIGTRSFWVICSMYFLFAFGLYTVMVHIVANATDIQISAAVAATILSVIGIISTGSKIGMGSLGDRIGNRNIMIIVFILSALSFLWVRSASELWMLYLFAAVFGLAYGGFATMQSALVADYFGLRSHGAIFGLAMLAVSVGGASGSLISGRIFDISGSYQWAFTLCSILGVGGLALALLLRAPRKSDRER